MGTVRYDHAVIIDGVFYPADTDIPVKTVEPEEKPEKKAVKKNDKRTSKASKAGDSAE